jgi:type IV pilus assembly protein PilY1
MRDEAMGAHIDLKHSTAIDQGRMRDNAAWAGGRSAMNNTRTMSIMTHSRLGRGFAAGRLLVACVTLLPAFAAQAAVDVDQSPLIVTEPLPPNIMLMYDDSGSMGWNFLPDDWSGDFQDVRDNQMYYDPRVEYEVPPRADGSLYPETVFPEAYRDPFPTPSGTESIVMQYRYRDFAYVGRGNGNCNWDDRYECVFAYVDPADGVEKYVSDDCSRWPNGNCSDDADIQQNVANWYSYYRIREYAAKSGIMAAFADIDPEFRVGFGSINSNEGGLRGVYRFGSKSEVNYGNGLDNHVRRESFWDWLSGIYSSGGTPLRQALKRVGDYYDDDSQPWEAGYDENGDYNSDQYSCRQSYTILMTDGYWNGGDPGVYNADNLDGSNITSADGQSTYQYDAPEPPFSDGYSNTLADVAMTYWKKDLRTDPEMKNDVPTTQADPAFWQHMTTFTIGLGFDPTGISPSDATMPDIFDWARTGSTTAFDTSQFSWPQPSRYSSNNIADLAHAGVNGHGDFFSARDPQKFAQGLKDALAAIDNGPGAGNSQTFSGGTELTSDSVQYVADYVTGDWTGSVRAYEYVPANDDFDSLKWRAANQLPAAASRNIWTSKEGNGNQPAQGIEFMASELTTEQQDALTDNIDTPFSVPAADIVSYLRGDRNYEDSSSTPLAGGDTLRRRAGLLGDIVTSTPVVVGPPNADLYDEGSQDFDGLDDYDDFVTDTTVSSRDTMLYIAANDGMLHAFDAETGVEKFAYIPGALLKETGDGALSRLANPEYGRFDEGAGTQSAPHQYFNDGEMTTQNVYIGGDWKTVLVGTTGRGSSRTIYALDITDPSVLADPGTAGDALLWERSAGDGKTNADAIGMALGRPTIALVKDGPNGSKWVVLVGNGPNSDSDEAALLQFELEDGDLDVYSTNNATSNGLSAPYVIQVDSVDGISEWAFAGDLQGNVWKFPLEDGGGSGDLIYVAKDDNGNRQPITARMLATKNADDSSIWVFFGTGKYLTKSDVQSAEVQTWYGLRTLPEQSGKPVVESTDSRSDLQEREILAEVSTSGNVGRVTDVGSESDLTSDNDVGWYMDLVSPVNGEEGERIIYTTQLIAGRLIVNTLIPVSNDPCRSFPAGATMIVDPYSGANPNSAMLDVNGDGGIDMTGDGTTLGGDARALNGIIYEVGASGAFTALINADGNIELFGAAMDSGQLRTEMTRGPGGAQRLNWRELVID